tara:strand:+ start:1559 stop:1873 length:315 start_codon:yes stop_codon:yes gene_type:complete
MFAGLAVLAALLALVTDSETVAQEKVSSDVKPQLAHWEYKVIWGPRNVAPDVPFPAENASGPVDMKKMAAYYQSCVNQIATEGWELVSVDQGTYYFKRHKRASR